MNLSLFVRRQLVELPDGHPAAESKDRRMPGLAAEPVDTMRLPHVGETVDADVLDLDLGKGSPCQQAAPLIA